MSRPGIVTALVIATAAGLAAAVTASGPGAPPSEFVVHGAFDAGLGGWTPIVSDTANRVRVEPRSGSRAPLAHFVVRRVSGRPPAWHTNLVQKNQRLQSLAPASFYSVEFRARASSPRRITVALSEELPQWRNLGLDVTVPLDTHLRRYRFAFRTDSVLSAGRDSGSSGAWLSFLADTLPGDTWIGDVSLRAVAVAPAPAPRATRARSLSTPEGDVWQGGGTWSARLASSGARAWDVTLAADGARFLWRDAPIALDSGAWDLVLRLWVDAPQNLARVSLMARSGSAKGLDDTIASTSGFVRGWNLLRFPRERFFQHWFSRFTWANAHTLGVRLEANGNGPVHLALADLTVAPRASAAPDAPALPRISVPAVASDHAIVTIEGDVPITVAVEYGPTPAYGGVTRDPRRARAHRVVLEGLSPGTRYHARVQGVDARGGGATSGDFVFRTPLTSPPGGASANAAPFDIGIFGVTTIDDLRDAGATSFNGMQSYQHSSSGRNTNAEARRYLEVADSLGVGVLMGFDRARVEAADVDYVRARVRELRSQPALRAWYIYDEPEIHKLAVEKLAAVYHAVRAEDPAHPVAIGSSWLGAEYPYRGAFDVAIVDFSPIPYAGPATLVPVLERARRSGERWQFTFQAFALDLDHRWPASGKGPGRYPTRDEMRTMAYLAVNHGAQGLWAFSYDYLHETPGSEWKWVELTELARELRDLAPVWSSAAAPAFHVAKVSDPALDVAVHSSGGNDYLVAINTSARQVSATIEFADAPEGAFQEVTRVDADADLAGPVMTVVRDGRVASQWAPYAVHVYRIVPAAQRR